MHPQKIRAVVFDADGMVVTGLRFSDRLERDYGISTEATREFFASVFPDCVVGRADLKEVLPPYLARWGWGGSLEELLDFWFGGEHRVDERLIAWVGRLKDRGVRCLLATNQEKYRTAYFAKEMGLGAAFDAIVSSSDIGVKKPQKEFFERLAKAAGVAPAGILYFDDRASNIEAARTFGFDYPPRIPGDLLRGCVGDEGRGSGKREFPRGGERRVPTIAPGRACFIARLYRGFEDFEKVMAEVL